LFCAALISIVVGSLKASGALPNGIKETAMRRLQRNVGPAALGLVALGAMILSAAARAEAPSRRLVLSGYADGVQGENLIAGRYADVIHQLAGHGAHFEDDEVSASTNLCVAYIMTRHFSAAHAACDEALRDAKLDPSSSTMLSHMMHNEEVAIAYSNRAVLKLVEAQSTSASSSGDAQSPAAARARPVAQSSSGSVASP
jgi:hypothetical protein